MADLLNDDMTEILWSPIQHEPSSIFNSLPIISASGHQNTFLPVAIWQVLSSHLHPRTITISSMFKCCLQHSRFYTLMIVGMIVGTPCIAWNQASSQPHATTIHIHIIFRFPTSESHCLPTPYPNESAAGRSKHYTDPQDACTIMHLYFFGTCQKHKFQSSSRSITIAVKELRLKVHLRHSLHIQIPSEYHCHLSKTAAVCILLKTCNR